MRRASARKLADTATRGSHERRRANPRLSRQLGDCHGARDPALSQTPSAQRAVGKLLFDPLKPRRFHSRYPINAIGSKGAVDPAGATPIAITVAMAPSIRPLDLFLLNRRAESSPSTTAFAKQDESTG
jgi:hypothetical protein